MIIRPTCDTPALQAMFPGDEILGLKAWVWDCPHRPQGSRLSVIGFVWLPKCEQRPYEVAVEGRLFLNNEGSNAFRRHGNALRAPLFEHLEPVSLRTREKLRDWSDYLEWRSHLLMATKVGIRFIAARIDVPRRNLVFTVIAESCESFNANRFWERHEPVYACGRDTAVTPECVYAVYNHLATSDKSVVDFPYGRHECYLDQYYKWIKELQADWGIR